MEHGTREHVSSRSIGAWLRGLAREHGCHTCIYSSTEHGARICMEHGAFEAHGALS